jgi:hypothetical protein
MMRNRIKFGGGVALALLTACGGATEDIELSAVTTTVAASATTAAPTTAPTPDVSEELAETTIAPVDEPAADATDDSASPAADTGPLTLVGKPATPNGPALTADLDVDDVDLLLESLLGPSDDLAGTAARLGPFPSAVTTMPATTVTGVNLRASNDLAFEPIPESLRSTLSIEAVTTADPADVILTYQTQLAAAGFTNGASGTQDSNGTTVHFVSLGDHSTGLIEIVAFTIDGSTIYEIEYQIVSADTPNEDAVSTAAGWAASVPTDDGVLNDVTIGNYLGTKTFVVKHVYFGDLEAVSVPEDADRFLEAGWVLENTSSYVQAVDATSGASGTISYFESDTEFGPHTVRTFTLHR